MGGGSLGLDREERSLEPLSFNTFEWLGSSWRGYIFRFQEKAIDSVGEDMMVWINLYSNQFSVKYLYVPLEPRSMVSFPK